jgi:hypothetical protein
VGYVVDGNSQEWKLQFGDEVIGTSDLAYAVGAQIICRYANGSREFRVVSVDKETKVCRVVEVKK